jgi:zinc transporter
MTNNSPLLHALKLDGQGSALEIAPEQITSLENNNDILWLHLDINQDQTRPWLEEHCAHIDPLVIDALLADETRPRITELNNGVLIILRGINLNDDSEPEDMVSIRFWIEGNKVISTRLRKLKSVHHVRDTLSKGTGPKTAAEIFTKIATQLFKRMEPFILNLDERIDNIEEAILENANISLRQEIIDIRKTTITLRRYIIPQKEIMSTMRMAEFSWIDTKQKREINENYNQITRLIEELDVVKEHAQIVKDELSNILADKMNKNTYVLSIVAAIFLPLGFITGLLGVNIGGMPGVENEQAFWLLCLACIIFTAILGALFKIYKWL